MSKIYIYIVLVVIILSFTYINSFLSAKFHEEHGIM